jgi:hypothetical protein
VVARLLITPKHREVYLLRGRVSLQEVYDLFRPYSPLARMLFRFQLAMRWLLPDATPTMSAALDAALNRLEEWPTTAAAITSSWEGRIVLRVDTPGGEWFVKHGDRGDEWLRNEGRALLAIPPGQRKHFAQPSRFLDDEGGVTLVTRRLTVHTGRVAGMPDA